MNAATSGELPWLDGPRARVAHALQADRMPAGLLIHGRPGVGRERLAEEIARARLCLEPGSDAGACGRCSACREMDAGAHPDFLTVHPEEEKKTIRVEQVRELSRGLALTAGNRGVRCAILSPAEVLTKEASNALLKTLEEPPPGVTLILIADSVSHLLPTIRSRCLRLVVPTPAREQALSWLQERAERADWPLLLELAGGAPLAAEALAAEIGADVSRRLGDLISAAAQRGDPIAVAHGFESWSLVRYANLVAWLAWAILRTAASGRLAAEWASELTALSARANARRLARTWREANRTAENANVLNPSLARERLILLLVDAFTRPDGERA